MDLKLLLVILNGLTFIFLLVFVAQTQAEFSNNLHFLRGASVAVRQTCGSFNLSQIFAVARKVFRSSLWE